MITMKKKVFLMALVGAALTACSNHDDVYSPEKYAEAKLLAKVAEYNSAFQKEFGTPAPGHTWGFGTSTRSAVTRACIKPDMTEYQNYEPAPAVDESEISTIQSAFQNIPEDFVSEQLNYTTFYVQHISASHRNYKDGNNSDVDGSSHMDHFKVWKDESVTDGTHSLDFNQSSGSTRLYVDEGTFKFSYHNSTDSKDHFDYIIKKVGDYYYVGFSFKATGDNPNQKVAGDNNYDDWIVRIVPAKLKSNELFQVWCEDLGGEYGKNGNDFDFNDVVLSFVKNGNNTEIWLLAAGGTLKLNVEWDGKSKEVHEVFEVPTNTMVNTGRHTVEKKLLWPVSGTVTKEELKNRLTIKVMDSETGVWYALNNTSSAPQMIVCEPEVIWPNERVNINDAFADDAFKKWVEEEPSKPFYGRKK